MKREKIQMIQAMKGGTGWMRRWIAMGMVKMVVKMMKMKMKMKTKMKMKKMMIQSSMAMSRDSALL